MLWYWWRWNFTVVADVAINDYDDDAGCDDILNKLVIKAVETNPSIKSLGPFLYKDAVLPV